LAFINTDYKKTMPDITGVVFFVLLNSDCFAKQCHSKLKDFIGKRILRIHQNSYIYFLMNLKFVF